MTKFLSLLLFTSLLLILGINSQAQEFNKPLNIDFLLRGHFYASSPSSALYNGFGGWAGCGNEFLPITDEHKPSSGVGILADLSDHCSFLEEGLGFKVFLYNTTSDTVFFDAQDSRLSMKIQAQDDHLEWKDIEYLPGSWCGNSYHTLYLPPDYYWEFAAPVFEGSLQTQLRVMVEYRSEFKTMDLEVIYSNQFAGTINPGQFLIKEEYTPQDLMDPYDN